jgi:TM2 domain-containing membrane protein YozV
MIMRIKNKTTATYLALFLGLFGAHRFYLKGLGDVWGWLQIAVSAVGFVGLRRIWALGQDDQLAWALVPFLGFSLFAASLAAIVMGLADKAKWNEAYNPAQSADHAAGASSGMTIFGVILALLLGATALMSSIAFTGQRFFEYSLKSA